MPLVCQTPALMHEDSLSHGEAASDSPARYRWAAWTLIVCVSVLRLIYLAFWCPLDLAPDEAYYWDWSRQLDWSYHSKGPLVAWLIRLSCDCFGNTMLAVR